MMPPDSPNPLRAALDWLMNDHDGDPESELAELHYHVTTLAETSLSATQRLDVLEPLCQRALEVSGRFRPALLLSHLPCPRMRYEQTSTLIDVLFALAGFARLLVTGKHWWRWSRMPAQAKPIELGLDALGEAGLLSALVGASTPSGLWQRAHELWLAADQYEQLKDDNIEIHPSKVGVRYQRLLLMAISQTETLTAREQQWLFDYLESAADELVFSLEPLKPAQSAYWFDASIDSGPVSCLMRMPERGRHAVVYFSPAGLARRLGGQILWLEESLLNADEETSESNDSGLLDTESAGLPVGLAPVEVLALLRRLKARWASMPTRAEARSRQHYAVEVCAGIKSVWAAGYGASGANDRWTVYNESPNGYAILSVGGVRHALSAGMVIALRREASQSEASQGEVSRAWSLCIVRWIRSGKPDQIELGLQLIARDFSSASICFAGNDAMVPALILDAESQARRNPALVTPAGSYVSNNFILVRENGRLYVAHGRALGLEMQTASIELLQYEIDYFPKSRRTA
jgi:hypothetical protein